MRIYVLVVSFSLVRFFSFSQASIELIKDINTSPASSNINGGVAYNGGLVFFEDSQLWFTDGTELGTILLKNFGNAYLASRNLIVYNGEVFFGIRGVNNTYDALWKTNGSAVGTVAVKTFTESDGVYIYALEIANGKLFFGNSPYVSDGTTVGTVRLETFDNYGFYWWFDAYATTEHIYMTNDRDIFKSDGTKSNTLLLASFPFNSNPKVVSHISNTLLVVVNSKELWGVDSGTGTKTLVKTFRGIGGQALDFIFYDGRYYFVADDGITGYELWSTDATSGGTKIVKDIKVGVESSALRNGIIFNNLLYFVVGFRLWRTDGTMVNTIEMGAVPSLEQFSTFHVINNELVFFSSDVYNSSSVFKWNGTAFVTLATIDLQRTDGFKFNTVQSGNVVFFEGLDPTTGRELWRTDGTETGTKLVKDISVGTGSSGIHPSSRTFYRNFTELNGYKYFNAFIDGDNDYGLWRTDGTADGTIKVEDGEIYGTAAFDKFLLLNKYDQWFGSKLYKSNGEVNAASLLKNLNANLSPYSTGVINSKFYFAASDGVAGAELWMTDGTEVGTVLVKDINPGPAGSDPANFLVLNSILYFSANNNELWRSDGTESGTFKIFTRLETFDSWYLTAHNDAVYFSARTSIYGEEVWKSDGTELGTVVVKDIMSGIRSSDPSSLASVGEYLFFVVYGLNGHELWKTDGTESGTVKVKDVDLRNNGYEPRILSVVNGKMIFNAFDGVNGRELWVSDGTEAGTTLLKDFNPGTGSTSFQSSRFEAINNSLFFTLQNPTTGDLQIWKTDGTEAGTLLLTESGINNAYYLTSLNDGLILAAYREDVGYEMFKLIETKSPKSSPSVINFHYVGYDSLHASYSPVSGNPSGYLVLRKKESSPSFIPQSGIEYPNGVILSDGSKVILYGSSLSFYEGDLEQGVNYFYDVYAYIGTGGSVIYSAIPLEAQQRTLFDGSPPIFGANQSTTISTAGVNVTFSTDILDDESGVISALVKYRIVPGQSAYESLPLVKEGNSWVVSINNTLAQQAIEYFFEATNGASLVATSEIHEVAVSTIGVFASPTPGFASTAYRILSFPYQFPTPTMDAIFKDDLGERSNTTWEVYHYSNQSIAKAQSAEIGKGYWFISSKPITQIDLPEGTTLPVSEGNPYTLSLSAGWNQIGNPYVFDVAWTDVQTANSSNLTLRTYEGSFANGSALKKFSGGFVFTTAATTLAIPPIQNRQGARVKELALLEQPIDQDEWEVRFLLANGIEQYSLGGLGMRRDAIDMYDTFDDVCPPAFEESLELSFDKSILGSALTKDIVGSSEANVWNFTVQSSEEESTMHWDNSYFGGGQKALFLQDQTTQQWVDMAAVASYRWQGKGSRKFTVRYADRTVLEESLTDGLVLQSIYPNPISEHFTLTILTPKQYDRSVSEVSLIDAMGRTLTTFSIELIKGLHHYPASLHTNELSKGTYLLQIKVANQVVTQRVITLN